MVAPQEIVTLRARLRRLCEADLPAFTRMNADSGVMRFFPAPWTAGESRTAFDRVNAEFDKRGFGIYALEVGSAFAGFVGLSVPSFAAWFTPCVEILWRLQPEFWGRGLASEAARAVLDMGADSLALPEVFAFAVAHNTASLRVMERIGMKPCDPPSFDHPAVDAPGFKRHLLYRARLASRGPGIP